MEKRAAKEKAAVSEREILRHEFLTIAEVALLLRVTERTVYNLIYQGTLRAVKVTKRITIIPKEDFLNMIRINDYNATLSPSKPSLREKAGREGKEKIANDEPIPQTAATPRKRKAAPLKPATSYKQSVKDTFTDADTLTEPVYTMEEICRRYSYTYGRFYNLRMRYSIPCVRMDGHKCFPRSAVDEAMTAERERLGRDLSADWYSCYDLMKKFGLGKTQVRRFAVTHGVRMKKMYNRRMYYLKADWDAARREAEAKSASTKKGRL